MYHSITIGGKNTWDDWKLIPSSRPNFALPGVETNFIELPGMDGVVDLSDNLVGKTQYKQRSGSIDFIMVHDNIYGYDESFKSDPNWAGFGTWAERLSEITNFLHGKLHRAVLEDDPGYFYEGRFEVNQFKSDQKYSTITINYALQPFKFAINGTTVPWLWDPFNFETDTTLACTVGLSISTTPTNVQIDGASEKIAPKFKWTGTKSLFVEQTIDGTTTKYMLPKGGTVIPGFYIQSGVDTLKIYTTATGSTGTLTIYYRKGSL